MIHLNASEKMFRLVVIILYCMAIVSCAASDVSRTAARGVDNTTQDVSQYARSFAGSNLADDYANMDQRTKGAWIGGATGGVIGALAPSSVGVVPGIITGAILGASYGAYIDSVTTLRDQLENMGALVVVLGDEVRIILPSSRLFEPLSCVLKPGAYPVLAATANYINYFTKILVKVAAYTNEEFPESINHRISQQQANIVAEVLQDYDVDARLLYAIGYGNQQYVMNVTRGWYHNLNYRIEISFEKLYV